MKGIRKLDAMLNKKKMEDIQKVQRLMTSEADFTIVYELLVTKYSSKTQGQGYTKEIEAKLDKFWAYNRTQWGPGSHVSNWWEGVHPFQISHNQGIERENLTIKNDYSHRQGLPIGKIVEMCEQIIEDESKRDDTILNGKQTAFLEKDFDKNIKSQHHKIQEERQQYYTENLKTLPSGKRKPGKLLKVVPDGKYTLT